MADKLSFSTFQLIINNDFVNFEDFEVFKNINSKNFHYDGKYANVNIELNDKYLWLFFQYGSPEPRAKNVIDIKTNKTQNNPRKETQAELNEQLFFLYDFHKNVFFLNKSNKIGFVKQFLTEHIDKTIIIKTIYVSIEEFSNKIKSIENINFTGCRDLFSSQSDIFKGLKDVFGYGEPESFKIEAKYSIPINEKIKNTLRQFDTAQKEHLLDSLVCIGKDENGFSTIFNSDSFSQKINLSLNKNDENLFNEDDVKNLLIDTIGIENV